MLNQYDASAAGFGSALNEQLSELQNRRAMFDSKVSTARRGVESLKGLASDDRNVSLQDRMNMARDVAEAATEGGVGLHQMYSLYSKYSTAGKSQEAIQQGVNRLRAPDVRPNSGMDNARNAGDVEGPGVEMNTVSSSTDTAATSAPKDTLFDEPLFEEKGADVSLGERLNKMDDSVPDFMRSPAARGDSDGVIEQKSEDPDFSTTADNATDLTEGVSNATPSTSAGTEVASTSTKVASTVGEDVGADVAADAGAGFLATAGAALSFLGPLAAVIGTGVSIYDAVEASESGDSSDKAATKIAQQARDKANAIKAWTPPSSTSAVISAPVRDVAGKYY